MDGTEAAGLALARYSAAKMAETIAMAVEVAAQFQKESLAISLAKVFDLEAVKEDQRRLIAILSEVQSQVNQAVHLLNEFHVAIDRIDTRFDATNAHQERLEVRQRRLWQECQANTIKG